MLGAPTPDLLLPTIVSRVQRVTFSRLSDTQLEPIFKEHPTQLTPQERSQMLFIADGRPGTLLDMLRDNEVFMFQRELMQKAKRILTDTLYERLILLPDFTKDRTSATTLVDAMARIVHHQLLSAPNQKWVMVAERLETCATRLLQNGNPRAQLTALLGSY